MAETVTPDDYFVAGLDLLADEGPNGVTVASLCRRLGVTKGSFYHHFGGTPDFMVRLLRHWEGQEEQLLKEAQVRAERDRPTEVAKLAATWAVRHETETAVRALARTDPVAGQVLRRVDARREENLHRLFVHLGMDPHRATVLARVGMAILIGVQHGDGPVDRRRLQAMLGEYQRWVEHVATSADQPGVRAIRRDGVCSTD